MVGGSGEEVGLALSNQGKIKKKEEEKPCLLQGPSWHTFLVLFKLLGMRQWLGLCAEDSELVSPSARPWILCSIRWQLAQYAGSRLHVACARETFDADNHRVGYKVRL